MDVTKMKWRAKRHNQYFYNASNKIMQILKLERTRVQQKMPLISNPFVI